MTDPPGIGPIRDAFHRPGTRAYVVVHTTVWVLIVASIVLLAVELAVEPGPALERWVTRADRAILWIFAAFRDNALLFGFALSLLGVTVLLGGGTLYLVEAGPNPDVDDLADGFWWAIVTLTTVGFGDISPVTPVGRVVGAALMVAGLFNLALFAGIVGSTLLGAVLSIREEQFRMAGTIDHVVICGWDAGALVIGLQDRPDEEHAINPPGDRVVEPDDRLVSLARTAVLEPEGAP
ncbi:MAG: potassium channel family protein [Gemmatimonadota bacterium]|nr:potassium channel family protein [Gemmatimonadota bacterium]